jgi:hypothetical protein
MGSIVKEEFLGKSNSNPMVVESWPSTLKIISTVGTRPSLLLGAGCGSGGFGN